MTTRTGQAIDKLRLNQRKLFLIDGLGAIWTAFVLIAIVAWFEDSFGMPRKVLYYLSLVACIYAVYSFSCYFFVRNKWRPYIKTIAIANIIYCCITFGLVIYYYESLTVLGVIYFLLEIFTISSLVMIELVVISGR